MDSHLIAEAAAGSIGEPEHEDRLGSGRHFLRFLGAWLGFLGLWGAVLLVAILFASGLRDVGDDAPTIFALVAWGAMILASWGPYLYLAPRVGYRRPDVLLFLVPIIGLVLQIRMLWRIVSLDSPYWEPREGEGPLKPVAAPVGVWAAVGTLGFIAVAAGFVGAAAIEHGRQLEQQQNVLIVEVAKLQFGVSGAKLDLARHQRELSTLNSSISCIERSYQSHTHDLNGFYYLYVGRVRGGYTFYC